MRASRARAFTCVLLLSAAAAAACSDNARRTAATEAPLTIKIGTFVGAASMGRLVSLLTAEPLISVAWDGRPSFKLAESATESADGLELTIRLRPDVKLHNGDRFTAVVARELLASALSSRGNAVARVEALDDFTLFFKLKRPFALRPIDFGAFNIDDETRPAMKTGPFKVVSLDPIPVLESFPEYYQGRSTVDRVEIRQYPTHRAAWTAMMRGEVNFLHEVSRDAIDFLEAGGDIQAYRTLRPYYVPLVFNVRHPLLGRTDVRLAISEAIDKTEVVENGMRGHAEIIEGPVWPFHWAYPRGRYPTRFNPEAAKIRLDAAGFPLGRREHGQPPARLRFTCLIPASDQRFERIGLVVQRQLYAVGIDMQLEPVPQLEFLKRIVSKQFEAFIFEMLMGRTLEYPYMFWHSRGSNALSGFSAADAALNQLQRAVTDDEVRTAVTEVMRVLRSDPPAVFLALPREARAADKQFLIPHEPDQDVFATFWKITRRPQQLVRSQ